MLFKMVYTVQNVVQDVVHCTGWCTKWGTFMIDLLCCLQDGVQVTKLNEYDLSMKRKEVNLENKKLLYGRFVKVMNI